MSKRAFRVWVCLGAVAIITFVAFKLIPVNATTAGFAYLLLVLAVASSWGFLEAAITSVAATLMFNRYFLPPIGTFTIADPQNWVALFSFLATALVASRLSEKAKRRALDAIERQRDIERLYSFSRAILLSVRDEPFPKQLVRKLAEIFELSAAVLYDRRTGELYRDGPLEFEGLDQQLRDAALSGTSFSDAHAYRTITAVHLGSEPIASLAIQGIRMPDSVLQGVANLVAIGLERARAQDLAQELEAAQRSEQLRTTLIDAMAHDLKTPLTLIKGATSAVLAGTERLSDATKEQLTIADEEAEHLRELLDTALEIARLDTAKIDVRPELSNIQIIVGEVIASMRKEIEDWPLEIAVESGTPLIPVDKRLIKLALKQLVNNAVKYAPPDLPVVIRILHSEGMVTVEVTDHGPGITDEDQGRIFERFYRGRSVRNRIPGSGLGLNIAYKIAHAHHGELAVKSRPGETTFTLTLPVGQTGSENN